MTEIVAVILASNDSLGLAAFLAVLAVGVASIDGLSAMVEPASKSPLKGVAG